MLPNSVGRRRIAVEEGRALEDSSGFRHCPRPREGERVALLGPGRRHGAESRRAHNEGRRSRMLVGDPHVPLHSLFSRRGRRIGKPAAASGCSPATARRPAPTTACRTGAATAAGGRPVSRHSTHPGPAAAGVRFAIRGHRPLHRRCRLDQLVDLGREMGRWALTHHAGVMRQVTMSRGTGHMIRAACQTAGDCDPRAPPGITGQPLAGAAGDCGPGPGSVGLDCGAPGVAVAVGFGHEGLCVGVACADVPGGQHLFG